MQRFSAPAVFALLFGLVSCPGCVLGLRSEPADFPLERPPPREEAPDPKPAACGQNCRFVPGYWHWDGGTYVWIRGRWEPEAVANSKR